MAKRKRITRVTEEDVPDENERHDEKLLEDPGNETLDYVLKGFDSRDGLEVKYYRVTHTGSAFVGSFPDLVPETQLQEWYPEGGRYEVRFYIHGEFRDRRFVNIAPRPGAHVGNGSSGSAVEGLLREQLAMMREEIRDMRNNRNGQSSSAAELAQAVGALKELIGPQQNNLESTINTSIMLAKLIRGIPEEDDSFGGIVKGVVKESGPALLQALLQKPNGAAPPQQLNPAPTVDPMEQMKLMLRGAIIFLKKKCLSGSDPGLYIDFVLDNREEERFAILIHHVLNSEFDVFTALDAEIAKPLYSEFFRTIYDGIRSAFGGSNPVASDTGGPRGDVPNIADHAPSSKKRGK